SENPVRVAGVLDDRVQAQATRAWIPARGSFVVSQTGQLLPRLGSVGGSEQRGVLDTCVDQVGVGQRRLEVPHARELPGVIRVVVVLVSPGRPFVVKLVASGGPGGAAVV